MVSSASMNSISKEKRPLRLSELCVWQCGQSGQTGSKPHTRLGNQIVPGHGQVLLAMRADWGLKQRHGRQRQGGKCVTMRGRLYRGKPCLRAR